MATSPSGRPSWQRNRAFKFFASVKLAVVLLAVLIVASIAGTIWESTFDAKVARAYVYGAPWFNIWLLILVANLTVSALSRWPWKKHHVAFLVTHLGIITLLFGSLIGRIWGVEGTITLFKGEPPSNRLLIDQHQLRVRDTDGIIKGYPAEFINRHPTPENPRDLGALASGARLSIVEYAPAVEGKLNPKPLESGGVPAVHFTITTAMMGQRLESWLLADDDHDGHGTFNMGLATIDLKRGTAPPASPNDQKAGEEVEIEESIFAFTKSPDQQVAKSIKGGSTGAKVLLSQPENGNKGSVSIGIGGSTWTHDVAADLGKDTAARGQPLHDADRSLLARFPDRQRQTGVRLRSTEQSRRCRDVAWSRSSSRANRGCPHGRGRDRRTKSPDHLHRGRRDTDLRSRFAESRALSRNAGAECASHHWLGGLAARGRSLALARGALDGVQPGRFRKAGGERTRRSAGARAARRADVRAMGARRLANRDAYFAGADPGGVRLEAASTADCARAAGVRSAAQ